ncbi:hypothetical protein [Bosea sp. (in: a-proteobacteria)]|uniref:hypothetical protein n=1 Tax=Bosea sp. (in: a-proteobacteria) TaxID=1871050 RepID=UPI001ACF40C1|nr:hypothetical protein [Bosea sp. (in: a-proteobacteria)]MBN9439257.1 hypothetical protein [Bosea sp. (in: a-proteobacteria)]MBN9449897.1 hypothetical protein [Bosea sp. (in: a-proteobacteria)]
MKQSRLDGVPLPADNDRQPPLAEASLHLALKLRLTSVVLGCSTSKELCARFAASNRATLFVPQNAYKWLGGKAMPRASSVYEDWARVLGGMLAAPFLASSSFDEFQDALSAHFAVPETVLTELRAEAGLPAAPVQAAGAVPSARRSGQQLGGHWLEGAYLAISPAWSRVQAGRLIVGQVTVHADSMRQLQINYSENLFNRQVLMSGQLLSDGRAAQSALTCSYTHRLFFLALNVPTPPANLIGGVLSGAAVHDPDARATASRILLLRAPASRAADLVARTGYIAAEGGQVENELAALGYRDEAERAVLGSGIVDFLGSSSSASLCEASHKDLGPLELMLDRLAPDEALQTLPSWH